MQRNVGETGHFRTGTESNGGRRRAAPRRAAPPPRGVANYTKQSAVKSRGAKRCPPGTMRTLLVGKTSTPLGPLTLSAGAFRYFLFSPCGELGQVLHV